MKLNKVENNSAVYSKEELLKKCAAFLLSAVMLGSLAACSKNVEVRGDGEKTSVSDSDVSSETETVTVETGYVEPKTFYK